MLPLPIAVKSRPATVSKNLANSSFWFAAALGLSESGIYLGG